MPSSLSSQFRPSPAKKETVPATPLMYDRRVMGLHHCITSYRLYDVDVGPSLWAGGELYKQLWARDVMFSRVPIHHFYVVPQMKNVHLSNIPNRVLSVPGSTEGRSDSSKASSTNRFRFSNYRQSVSESSVDSIQSKYIPIGGYSTWYLVLYQVSITNLLLPRAGCGTNAATLRRPFNNPQVAYCTSK